MKLSLVLATYGRATELDSCLKSLAVQRDCDFEILIMDQNPDDRLIKMIKSFQETGLAIRHERLPNPGLSEARNLGIQLATGDIVGFPDDDCWYEPDTVATILEAFSKDLSLSGVVANWVEQTEGGGNVHGNDGGFLSLEAWRNFRGGAASSISLFLKRDYLENLKGFDTRLGVGKWYGAAEETDLVLRSLTMGAQIKRLPDARVHHVFSSNPQHLEAAAAQRRARGTGAIYAKHRLPPTTVIRGLIAPLLKPLARLQLGYPLQAGWAIARGRLQGMQRWRREEA